MSATYVTSMLVMAALAVLVLVALVRSRRWYHYAPAPDEHDRPPALAGERRPPLLERPTTWIVGFVALMLGAVGGVFAFVTNPNAPGELFSLPVPPSAASCWGYLLYGTLLGCERTRPPQFDRRRRDRDAGRRALPGRRLVPVDRVVRLHRAYASKGLSCVIRRTVSSSTPDSRSFERNSSTR